MTSMENKKGYKKTKLGWIPAEWNTKYLKDLILKLNAGRSVNCVEGEEHINGKAILKTSAITGRSLDIKKVKIPLKKEVHLLRQNIEKHRILVCRKNTPEMVGVSMITTKTYSDIYLPDLIWQTEPTNEEHDLHFLNYVLSSTIIRHRIKCLANGSSTSMVNISKPSFLSIQIPFPTNNEQQKIATILSTWDLAIDKLSALIAAKEEQKKGLMQRLLTGRVRLKAHIKTEGYYKSRIGQVPIDWKVVKAESLFASISVKNVTGERLLAVTQNKGIIARDELEGRVTMPSGSTGSYKLVEPGDFVISLRSFQGGLEYSKIRGIVSPAYTILKTIGSVDHTYFAYYFKSNEFISRLAFAVVGIRDGKQISYKDFKVINFRLPPIDEQKKIGVILLKSDEELEILKLKRDELELEKKGLMQQLLTGKTRIKI